MLLDPTSAIDMHTLVAPVGSCSCHMTYAYLNILVQRLTPNLKTIRGPIFFASCLYRSSIRERIAESPQAESRQNTQADRQRLASLDCTRDRATGENERCEQTKLYAVGSMLLDA